ncbi:MAG: heparinase II/III family protein [Planctomycetes bacterium]|nr:heparinase II/III family protein [Planctomycetota bacterium]
MAIADWEALRREAPRRKGEIEAAARACREWFAAFRDRREWVSGWFHDYFCDRDGTRLEFRVDAPGEHRCPSCGTIYRDERRCQAWVYRARGQTLEHARTAAILWRVAGESDLLAEAVRRLRFYADAYDGFPVHGRWAGKGKLMGQSLDEAVAMTRIVETLRIAGDGIPAEARRAVVDGLLIPAARFILPQATSIHNIPTWIVSAALGIGLMAGDDGIVRAALDERYGLRRQVAEGILEDGMWYEGSIGYHFYTLRALLFALDALSLHPRPFETERARIRAAFAAPRRFAFDDGAFPTPGDSWAGGRLEQQVALYLQAARHFPDLRDLAAALRAKAGPPEGLAGWILDIDLAARTLGPVPATDFPGIRCAMLRSGPWNVFFKYGHRSRSHAHPDALSIELWHGGRHFLRDLGTTGYGAEVNRWYRSRTAHNTIVVDGKGQEAYRPGGLSMKDAVAEGHADEIQRGVTLRRRLEISGGIVIDGIRAASEEARTFDWIAHGPGDGGPCGASETASLPAPADSRLEGIRKLARAEGDLAAWSLGGARLVLAARKPVGEAYLFRAPDNPGDRARTGILIRAKGREASFDLAWRVEGA